MITLRLEAHKAPGLCWPVSFGIPIKKGFLKSGQAFTLADPDGRLIPCRTEENGYWPDGSERWLLLDAAPDMAWAGDVFTLAAAREWAGSDIPDVRVEERLDDILIDTGIIKTTLPMSDPGVLGTVVRDGQALLRMGALSKVKVKAGPVHRQAPPRTVLVEKKGPPHAVVFIEGQYLGPEPAFYYQYRLHFYAGLPLIRVEHTMINRSATCIEYRLEKVDLQFEPLNRPETLSFADHEGQGLRQSCSRQYEIDGQSVAGRYQGWVRAGNLMTLGVSDFWERFPASLRLEDGMLTAGLLDDDSRDGMLFSPGEAQTHDLWLWFGDDAPATGSMMSLINQRPLLVPPAEWMCESGVLGPLCAATERGHPEFEAGIAAGYEQIMRTREERDEYGYRNYGDSRYDAMPRGWLNNEYDWGHTWFLQFARTGERRYFDLAAACTRHTMDTDVMHDLPAPYEYLAGAPHAHSSDHTEKIGADIGHAWLECFFDYWGFLGEPRARKHGTEMGDFFARCVGHVRYPKYRGRPGARRPGWGLIGLMYAWHNTLDPRYLSAAQAVVAICAREQDQVTGAWIYSGGGLDDPRFPVGKTFMVALTLIGLQHYHEVTADRLAADMLIKGVDWMVDYMWDEQVGGFRYIDVPFDSLERSPGSSIAHTLVPIEYAFRLTGNPRYRYVAARTLALWLKKNNGSSLAPALIRHTLNYLPFHRRPPVYHGNFPLLSVKPDATACVRGFCVVDEKNVWVVGLYGLLARSRDGGLNWETLETGHRNHLYGIDFAGDMTGCAAGVGAHLMRTADGGETWQAIDTSSLAPSAYHHDLKMVDEQIGYLCGNGHIWKTEDGGRSWRAIWNNREDGRWDKVAKALSMAPLSRDLVWVVGSMRLALTIEGGGKSFVRRTLPEEALGIYFVDNKTGFAAGRRGGIARTSDGGRNWDLTPKLAMDSLWGIAFHDRQAGYAVGEAGTVMITDDGGARWRKIETGCKNPLRAVTVVSDQVALAAGDGGVVLRTANRGRNWIKVDLKKT